jgi:hypothetical protein
MNSQQAIPTITARSGLIIALRALAFLAIGTNRRNSCMVNGEARPQDIRAGFISPAAHRELTFGKWFAIVGTFLSPLWLLILAIILFVLRIVIGEVTLQGLGIGRW